MDILFTTSNPHKVREVCEILEPLGVSVSSLARLVQTFPEPDETGETFAENARQKAQAYAAMTGCTCLAEDSGLEVPALGGAPGVLSARYAGVDGSRAIRDEANNRKLLLAVAALPESERRAHFVCEMCLVNPAGEVLAEARGEYHGVITLEPRGQNGFGYDPLFYVPDLRLTSAELSPLEKHARSHRGQAARKLAQLIHSAAGLPNPAATR